MVLDRRQTLVLESVRRFLRRSAHGHLINLVGKTRPQDFPPIYEELTDRDQLLLFRILSERDAQLGANIMVELSEGHQLTLVRGLGTQSAARLIEQCSEDDAAEILANLEDESAAILEAMQPEEKAAVQQLLIYEDETAGRIMTSDVFSLNENMTVGEAISAVQSLEDVELAFYIYVVDDRRHLVGVLSLRELLQNRPQTPLKEIMNTDLLVVRSDTDQEEVAQVAAKYDLLAIPVVDEQGRLIGVVTIDDVIDVLREEATEDILLIAGTSGEERIEPSIWKSARTRTPWLMATFVGGLLASYIISNFENVLEALHLAAFIPIVLGMGGSAGNQAAIVMIRGIATGRLYEGVMFKSLMREIGTAGLLGFVYGSLLIASAYLMFSLRFDLTMNEALTRAVIVGVALALSMMFATTFGSTLPLLLNKLGFDPAISTTPFVTTATDVLGSLTYLGLAQIFFGL